MIEKTIAEELEQEAAEERPLFDEDALGGGRRTASPTTRRRSRPRLPAAGDIFANFPAGGSRRRARTATADDGRRRSIPSPSTELDD